MVEASGNPKTPQFATGALGAPKANSTNKSVTYVWSGRGDLNARPLRPRQSRNSYVVVFSVRSLAKFAEKADHSALSAHKLHTSSTRGLGREGVRAPVPQLNPDDAGHLRAHNPRPGRRGREEMGGVPAAQPARSQHGATERTGAMTVRGNARNCDCPRDRFLESECGAQRCRPYANRRRSGPVASGGRSWSRISGA